MTLLNCWKHLSIRRKATVWLGAVVLVLILLLSITYVTRIRSMEDQNRLQQSSMLCYAVQEALEAERNAVEALARENSQTNQKAYTEACLTTARTIADLPFDYDEIGQERYARTWNLRSGYDGYCRYRNALAALDASDPQHSARFYEVVQMLDALSVYALRLAQATLEDGAAVYERSLQINRALPALNSVLSVIAIAAITAIFQLLDQSLIRPILLMSGQSRRIAENDFSVPDLTPRSPDEVGELMTAFNRMKHATRDHIRTLEEKNRIESALHREELAKLELEQNLDRTRLEMLKSQVNPHFLFNTLNTISCMAKLEDADTTDKMILSLSGLFRYNLRTKEQEVWLEQELEALEDYIYIQQMRFDGRITYKKEILADPLKVRLPSFTLQPVVENAFVHGLACREEGGRILLRVWCEGTDLRISITDNGVGMNEQQLAQLHRRIRASEQTGRGIGLGNISRRISMLYPEGGDFRIHSTPGRGTVIQFTIPQKERGDL